MSFQIGSGMKKKLWEKNTTKYPITSNVSLNVELLIMLQNDFVDTSWPPKIGETKTEIPTFTGGISTCANNISGSNLAL